MQNEEDVYLEKYSPEEINSYVKAINKVLDNLETYKSNCRKRICENFTISKMIEKMDSIFEEIHKNPSKKKIENGYGLSNNKDITKELITSGLETFGIVVDFKTPLAVYVYIAGVLLIGLYVIVPQLKWLIGKLGIIKEN